MDGNRMEWELGMDGRNLFQTPPLHPTALTSRDECRASNAREAYRQGAVVELGLNPKPQPAQRASKQEPAVLHTEH